MPDRTKIVIVDSGFGGLNLAANLETEMPTSGKGPILHVDYVNIAPSDARGYNQMETQAEKLRVFGLALLQIEQLLRPTAIYVACNTLSALLTEVLPRLSLRSQVYGIIACGADLLEAAVTKRAVAKIFLFATETTIESGIYQASLRAKGISSEKVVPCAAPGLATLISNDPEGDQVECRIKEVFPAYEPNDQEVGLFLGCTHYGFRSDRFEKVAGSLGLKGRLLDPTSEMAREVLAHYPHHRLSSKIPFWGYYVPPQQEITTISGLLPKSAPLLAHSILCPKMM